MEADGPHDRPSEPGCGAEVVQGAGEVLVRGQGPLHHGCAHDRFIEQRDVTRETVGP